MKTEYDSTSDTLTHVRTVQEYLGDCAKGTYIDGNARLMVEAPEMYSLLSRIIGNKSAMEHISDEWQDAVKSILERVG